MHAHNRAQSIHGKLEGRTPFDIALPGQWLLGRPAKKRKSPETIGIVGLCTIALAIVILAVAGLELRSWTWTHTAEIRFQHDIDNGLYWGGRVLDEGARLTGEKHDRNTTVSWKAFFAGYGALYDVAKQEAYKGDYHLDYPPLRLLLMALWASHTRQFHRDADKTSVEVVRPMLACNFLCELANLITIFLLVRFWVCRDNHRPSPWVLRKVPEQHRGWVAGVLAAAFLWLNPSVIVEAYGWPQWDVWVLPFFFLAALAASRNRWFWCGCALAIGGMFKGQLLLVAPFFILWPVWLSHWKGAFRVLLGLVLASAAVVFPWLIRNDFSWLQIGFIYGTEHYQQLFISSCCNLPALLARSGWSLKDTLARMELGGMSIELTLQWALRLLYLASLGICSWAAASYSQRGDARVLLSLAAPWLLMFGLLGQMHERYLLWGGAVTAVTVAIGLRTTLLHLLFTGLSTTMILHVMLLDKKFPATLHLIAFLNNQRAVGSIVFLGAAGAFFCLTVQPVELLRQFRARQSRQLKTKTHTQEAMGESPGPIAVASAG
jgi:hypothetical protein